MTCYQHGLLYFDSVSVRRTGMVVVPLILSLFDVSANEAKSFVEFSSRNYRSTDTKWPNFVHMPETEEQLGVVKGAEDTLRKKGNSSKAAPLAVSDQLIARDSLSYDNQQLIVNIS